MGEKILSWFERIVTGEKRRWFFAAVIVAIILGVIVFPYIDANFLYYNRIEKRIDNLTNLVNLTGVPLEENEMLYEEYLSILEEVKTARENALFGSGKAGGAFLWVIIAVVLLFSKKKGEQRTFKHWVNNIFSAIICLVFGGILGQVFVYIPTIGSSKVNFILAPIAEFIVVWLLMESPKSKAKEN